jgi:hypothetical protein
MTIASSVCSMQPLASVPSPVMNTSRLRVKLFWRCMREYTRNGLPAPDEPTAPAECTLGGSDSVRLERPSATLAPFDTLFSTSLLPGPSAPSLPLPDACSSSSLSFPGFIGDGREKKTHAHATRKRRIEPLATTMPQSPPRSPLWCKTGQNWLASSLSTGRQPAKATEGVMADGMLRWCQRTAGGYPGVGRGRRRFFFLCVLMLPRQQRQELQDGLSVGLGVVRDAQLV